MKKYKLSKKGSQLIKLYSKMVKDGYLTTENKKVTDVYNNFQLHKTRHYVKKILVKHKIKSILDYGSGGSDWNKKGFDLKTNYSAIEFFDLNKVYKFEPARNINEKHMSDCVICFDVLEHIFIGDIKNILLDIFQHAKKLVIINVACYDAIATLPNGENAHITVRHPMWWKGILDSISVEFKNIFITLICSSGVKESEGFKTWNAKMWDNDKKFKIDY